MDQKTDEDKEIAKLENALGYIDNAQISINQTFKELHKIIKNTESTIEQLAKEKDDLKRIEKEQEAQISGLNSEQMVLLKEYEQVKEELEKFAKIATVDGVVKIEDMKETLSVYRVLLDEIFQSQPHFKVIHVLHGDAEEMDIEQIKGATGIAGVAILRACHELAAAHLIDFDLDTKHVKLIRRLFPKRVLKLENDLR